MAATSRVVGNWLKTIIAIKVIGTARNAPGRPHSQLQNASDSRVATGSMFCVCACSRG